MPAYQLTCAVDDRWVRTVFPRTTNGLRVARSRFVAAVKSGGWEFVELVHVVGEERWLLEVWRAYDAG